MNNTQALLEQLRRVEAGHLPRGRNSDGGVGERQLSELKQKEEKMRRKAVSKQQSQHIPQQLSLVSSSSSSSSSSFLTRHDEDDHVSLTSSTLRQLLNLPPQGTSSTVPASLPKQPVERSPSMVFPVAAPTPTLTMLKSIKKQVASQEAFASELNKKFTDWKSSMTVNEVSIEKNIHVAVDLLPTELLLKYRRFEEVKDRGIHKMWDLLLRMRIQLLTIGLHKWKHVTEQRNDEIRARAGHLLVRVARGFIGRRRARHKREFLLALQGKNARLAAVSKLGRAHCALMIQQLIRSGLAWKNVKPKLLRHRAALKVQEFLKRRMLILKAKRRVRDMRIRNGAAKVIQKRARGNAGRRRFEVFRKTARHKLIAKAFETTEGTFQYYFQQSGAAAVIQRWFRKMPWYRKLLWRRKEYEYYYHRKLSWEDPGGKNKRRMKKKKKAFSTGNAVYDAMKLKSMSQKDRKRMVAEAFNHIARGFLGRRRVLHIRAELKRIFDLRTAAAIRIQSHLKRLLVHARMPLIGLRSRSLVLKQRRWTKQQKSNLLKFTPLQSQSSIKSSGSAKNEDITTGAGDGGSSRIKHGISSSLLASVISITTSLSNSISGISNEGFAGPPEYFAKRRMGVLFPKIGLKGVKLASPKELLSFSRAASKIAGAWRAHDARTKFHELRGNKFNIKASMIQSWGVFCYKRRKVVRFRAIIMEHFWERIQARVKAAKRIQSRYRVHASMKWLKNFKMRRAKGVLCMQRFFRFIIRARRNRKFALTKRRALLEQKNAGAEQFLKSELFLKIDHIWAGAKKTKTAQVEHDVQRFFSLTATSGMLDVNKMGKLAKECKGLLDAPGCELDLKTVELQFSKCKAPSEKRLDYERFIELITNLAAIRFLGIESSKLGGASNDEYAAGLMKARAKELSSVAAAAASSAVESGGGGGNEAPEEEDENKAKIAAFRFGRLRGRAALATYFIFTYLVEMKDFKKASVSLLKKAALGPAGTVAKQMSKKINEMQDFVRNRLAIKRIYRGWAQLRIDKLNRRQYKAASRINGMVSIFLSKMRVVRMAQTLYSKFQDEETGGVYWFNPRTRASFWTKPKMLGVMDCGMPIKLPPSELTHIILCSVCSDLAATRLCDECDLPYCNSCYAVAHKGGQRKFHTSILFDTCVQCDFQAASRECVQCGDLFCDSCYEHLHSKGRLRLHIYGWVTDACAECHTRASQWTHTGMENGEIRPTNYCLPCYKNTYLEEPAVSNDGVVYRYKYEGKSVRAFRSNKREIADKKAVAAAYAQRLAELKVLKSLRAAINIQRVYRGHVDRVAHRNFIAERKAFLVLREAEMPYRSNPVYHFLHFWGLAPALKSDTTLERVLKMYPGHMRQILEECIEHQWREACRLQKEQEEHMAKVGNPTRTQTALAQLALKNSLRLMQATESLLQQKMKALDVQKVKYRDERAKAKAKEEKKRALKEATEKLAAEVEDITTRKEKALEALQLAEERAENFIGPRGLQKMVEDRRKNGIVLPFKVMMYRGSRLALVCSVDDEEAQPHPALEFAVDGGTGGEKKGDNKLVEKTNKNESSLQVSFAAQAHANATSRPSTADSGSRPGSSSNSKRKKHWRKKVVEDDVLLINGMTFQVQSATQYLQELNEEKERKEEREKEKAERKAAREDESDDGEDSDSEEEEEEEEEEEDHHNRTHVEYTENHLVLDRPWIFDDTEESIPVAKMVQSTFYIRPLKKLGNAVANSFVPQKAVAISAITLHKLASLNTYLSTLFDDESDTGAWLRRNATHLHAQRDSVLKGSVNMVQMSFDFSLRRRLWKSTQKQLIGLGKVMANIGALVKSMQKEDTEGSVSIDVWEKSNSKTKVKVVMEIDGGVKSDKLAYMELDLKAPVIVMREYVRRTCRDKLNATYLGDSFLFFVVKEAEKGKNDGQPVEVTLARDQEAMHYSSEFAIFKMNNKTMEGAFTCAIVLDKESGWTDVPIVLTEAEKHALKHKKKKEGDGEEEGENDED